MNNLACFGSYDGYNSQCVRCNDFDCMAETEIKFKEGQIVEKRAVWKDRKVIGYVEMSRKVAEQLNKIHGVDIYIGYDKFTNPEMY